MTAVEQERLPLVPAHAVVPLPGADDDRDTGVLLRPRDAAGVIERLLDVLHERNDLRAEWNIAMRAGGTTRGRMARQLLLQAPDLLDVLSEQWTGPEARELATQIRDVTPGQCGRDRHCRFGQDHDGGCWPQGE